MRILVLLIFFAVVGCGSKQKKVRPHTDETVTAQYEKGLKELDAGNYLEASKILDRLLVQSPGTELDLVVLYNSASAYEGLKDCKTANERFRQVVRSSQGKFSRIESQALFRVALTYECLGQDTKTVTALLDAIRRGKDLPPEILRAEAPARLAAAYARLGNRTKALEYFNIANKGLKVLVRKTDAGQKEIMARTMYLMGQLSDGQKNAEMDPESYAHSVYIQQPYLLQSMEMNHPVWSKNAAEDLRIAYDNVWRVKVPQDERDEFLKRSLQNVLELKKLKLPTNNPIVESAFVTLDREENKIRLALAEINDSTKLTPEAERREGLRRDGHIQDANPAKPKKSAVGLPKKKKHGQ